VLVTRSPHGSLQAPPAALDPQFSRENNVTPRRYLETFLVVTLGEESATGVLWIEARDAAEDPTVHHLLPTGKRYPALNINRAEVEKPCSGPKAP